MMAVISGARERMLSAFGRQYGTSFKVLADPKRVVYGSMGNPTVIIIDRESIVRYAGRFTKSQRMKEEIELIRKAT